MAKKLSRAQRKRLKAGTLKKTRNQKRREKEAERARQRKINQKKIEMEESAKREMKTTERITNIMEIAPLVFGFILGVILGLCMNWSIWGIILSGIAGAFCATLIMVIFMLLV